jgi:hypothetical protein
MPVVHRDFPGMVHDFMTIQELAPAAAERDPICDDLRTLLDPTRRK